MFEFEWKAKLSVYTDHDWIQFSLFQSSNRDVNEALHPELPHRLSATQSQTSQEVTTPQCASVLQSLPPVELRLPPRRLRMITKRGACLSYLCHCIRTDYLSNIYLIFYLTVKTTLLRADVSRCQKRFRALSLIEAACASG